MVLHHACWRYAGNKYTVGFLKLYLSDLKVWGLVVNRDFDLLPMSSLSCGDDNKLLFFL